MQTGTSDDTSFTPDAIAAPAASDILQRRQAPLDEARHEFAIELPGRTDGATLTPPRRQ